MTFALKRWSILLAGTISHVARSPPWIVTTALPWPSHSTTDANGSGAPSVDAMRRRGPPDLCVRLGSRARPVSARAHLRFVPARWRLCAPQCHRDVSRRARRRALVEDVILGLGRGGAV